MEERRAELTQYIKERRERAEDILREKQRLENQLKPHSA